MAQVGLMRPKRLALGAAMPPPNARSSACAIGWLGTRSPTVSCPAVASALTRAERRTIKVSGPGQNRAASARVGIIMGSKSDWATMKAASDILTELGVPHESRIVSAHRTPDLLFEYVAAAAGRGLSVLIAGAGGAAHLPGMAASKTTLPVLGVPVQSKALSGMDSLLSIVQMPKGIPVGTLAIGEAGAANAGLLAAAILALTDPALRQRLEAYRAAQTARVLEDTLS